MEPENNNNGNLNVSGSGVVYRQGKELDEQVLQPTICGQWKKISIFESTENGGVESQIILNRVNHCIFYYKNCIYYYGGQQNTTLKTSTNHHDQSSLQLLSKTNQIRKQSLWNSFHKFNVSSKQYSRQVLNLTSNSSLSNLVVNLCSFGYFVLSNLLFIFGGVNCETNMRRNAEMCSINLQSGSIKKYESKTALSSIPSQRLRPIITSIEKSVLLLFGGQVYNQSSDSYQYMNDMYTFKIETKTWTKIEDSYHSKFPVLINPFIVNFGDNCLYLLGGKRQVLGNQGKQSKLVDNYKMYRCRIVTKTVSFKADCCIKQVYSTNSFPHSQTYVKALKYMDKGIIVITTDIQNYGKCSYFWYYDCYNAVWTEIKCNTNRLLSGDGQQFLVTFEKIISVQKNTEIIEMIFNQSMLENIVKEILKYQRHVLCSLCREEEMQNVEMRNLIPTEIFEQFYPIDFPYAVFGLLVDNVCLSKAKICNIYINNGSLGKQSGNESSKIKYLLIEDNGCPSYMWSPELKHADFIQIMGNFYSTTVPEELMAAQDNKHMVQKSLKEIEQKQKILRKEYTLFMKNQNKVVPVVQNSNNQNFHFKGEKDFEKEQHEYIEKKQRLQHKEMMIETSQRCRQFSNNIKLAGIKLGGTIIYVCKQKKGEQNSECTHSQKDLHRYFVMRKQKDSGSNKEYYVCYAYVMENGVAIDPKMQGTMKFINKQFKKELKFIAERLKSMNNVVLITDLKNISNEQENLEKSCGIIEMKFKKKLNDIFYGDSNFLNLESMNISKMSECCDISLKSYLSLLYVELTQLSIYISVRQNSLQLINIQPYLGTIDKMKNNKKIIEVSKSMDFADECSVVQIYWNPEYAVGDSIANRMNSLGLMLNGVLIYHRGRLITRQFILDVCRFDIELGKLLDCLETNLSYGSIFGFMEIKPEYGTNFYHTVCYMLVQDLFYPNSFEKYYAKLNFVNEFMQTKYREKRVRGRNGQQISSVYQKINKRTKHE